MAQSSNRDTFSFGDETGSSGVEVIDPATVGTQPGDQPGNGASEQPRKRGPKPGSTRKKATASFSVDVKGIEGLLLSVHGMLAIVCKEPGLNISKDEASTLAQAVANVQRHYPTFETTQLAVDWANLAMALILVYGTRAAAWKMKSNKKPQAGVVVPGPWDSYNATGLPASTV